MDMMPGMAPTPHVDAGNEYARQVVAGEILACKWVRLQCQRHLDDLENPNGKYFFSADTAEKWCKFLELLPHVKGKWALQSNNRLKLEPWQCFKTMCIVGWLRYSDGLRRYRKAVILEPRKNAKSTWAGGMGLGMFVLDNEYAPEVYSGATTEKQAWEVFGPARKMVMKTPAMSSHFGIDVMAKNLNKLSDGGKFEPLIGDPGDGSSPSCAIIDEYHEHDDDRMVDTMETGMGAREQPLMLIITTAGDNLAGPCYAMQGYAEKVLEGLIEDDELFALIYTIDKDVKWDTVEALRMANPNMGVSVKEEFLLRQQRIAKKDPRKIGIFKTKHLNIWVQAREAYFNVARFQEAEQSDIKLEDFHNQPVRIGLDLASKHDITAKEYVFLLDKCNCETAVRLMKQGYQYAIFGTYWIPEETIQAPENQHYRGWLEQGFIEQTEGEAVDYTVIRESIMGTSQVDRSRLRDLDLEDEIVLGDVDHFQLEEVVFDPHQARMMVSEMMDDGIPCVEMRPLVLNFSEPMKEVDAKIRTKSIAHDGCPVFTWMLSCVLGKEDQKDNVYPTKDKNQKQNKIDGPVALIMVVARWMTEIDSGSVYDKRGILTV